ncbi:8833_t:CDS:2 [Diversispora eburnea]|uniref:8833_t:CDS:1 n=1 Tax=Diversispora eburnea TaxID=1213867 RepID=A0A9N8VU19_9GLOM|nr:8833_t:CDS:2 [Diversispora eburnea]
MRKSYAVYSDSELSSLKSIFQKLINNNNEYPDYPKTLLKSLEFSSVLRGTSSKSQKIKPLSLLILTKLHEHSCKNNLLDLFKKSSSNIILDWLNSTEKNVKLDGYHSLEALFQISHELGSNILLKDGVMEDIMDCIEFEPDEVQISITELLSVACAQKNSRALVITHCQKYLTTLMTNKNQKLKTLAAVILTKIMLNEKSSDDINNNKNNDDDNKIKVIDENEEFLIDLFENMVLNNQNDVGIRINAIEGLAYSSLKSTMKEMISYHPTLLLEIYKLIQDSEKTNNTLFYGVAIILSNITSYKKKLSETEEKYLRLKKMAGESSSNLEPDPLDNDEYVINRCKQVMNSGVIKPLIIMLKSNSQVIRQLITKIFLNLATDQNNRGKIVQQESKESMLNVIHTLAKIAITMDPNLAFRGERSSDLVRPFLILCQSESELCQFEALMALTNLSGVDDEIRKKIFESKGIPIIENLQLSDNFMIRRAATEFLCNMMFFEPVFNLYSESEEKIKILVALSESEDFATKRAASGALAILSIDPESCQSIMKRSYGIDVLKALLIDQSEELQHRSLEIIKNMTKVDNNKEIVEALIKNKIHEELAKFIKKCKIQSLVSLAVEALKEISKKQ